MIPLKDDIPTRRVPVVTVVAIAAAVLAVLLAGGSGIVPLLVGGLWLWIFGATVEDATSRPRFLALLALAGAAAVALGRTIDAQAPWTSLALAGAVSAVVAGHLRLYPWARVVGVAIVPFAMTFVAPRSWLLAVAWALAQAAFALTAIAGPLAAGGAALLAACAAAAVAGLLAIPLLAQHRAPRPSTPLGAPTG